MRIYFISNNFFTTCAFLVIIFIPINAWSSQPPSFNYRASPDQVLVIYNDDWTLDEEGSDPGQDSKEIAEYYVRMHTDPKTGKKPYLLGLKCKHGKNHLNKGTVEEVSGDNKNGIFFKGKGKPPKNLEWVRDSKKVEISVQEGSADWNSVIIRCRSDVTEEEKIIYSKGKDTGITEVLVAGLPETKNWQRTYPPPNEGQGRSFRFDAARIFPGRVTVFFQVRDAAGNVMKDIESEYYDINDFAFSATGSDGISDEKILDEDVLTPVRKFLESPANALSDGTLLKYHIVYIVLVHGMPYSASGVFGIEHGATPRKADHGALAALEQRIQTLYYGWESRFNPPVVSIYMAEGPDAGRGVANHIITTAMRYPLSGFRWNPYMHPGAYASLGRDKDKYLLSSLMPSFAERRKMLPDYFHAYAVTRIDGGTVEEAKRIIDYSLYASRYLRPEMDCSVRQQLKLEKKHEVDDLEARLKSAEKENLWGIDELKQLGFRVIPISQYDGGVPFMVMPKGLIDGKCDDKVPKWQETGFYPGGMGREVISHNGWNNRKTGPIWQYLKKGVTVSACGAPAYDGGPHITSATFWDNRILIRYLFRGKDLGEAFLLSSFYVNWSTSLIGDPLMHTDLRETLTDNTPPSVEDISVKVDYGSDGYTATIKATIGYSYENPEVALLRVSCLDTRGQEVTGATDLFSRRPSLQLKSLVPDMEYACKATFRDPYDNMTTIPSVKFKVEKASLGKKLFQGLQEMIKGVK